MKPELDTTLHRRPPTQAFSLVEVMIAVGILAIGLVMIATVFPVALSQHRDSTDGAAAVSFAESAKAIVRSRMLASDLQSLNAPGQRLQTIVESSRLFRPSQNPGPFQGQSPWLAFHVPNILWGGAFDTSNTADTMYGDRISNPQLTLPFIVKNGVFFRRGDTLSDLNSPPPNDAAANQVPGRLVWYPFYHEQPHTHQIEFAVAITRQIQNQTFAPQNLPVLVAGAPIQNAFHQPTGLGNNPFNTVVRFPIPWRISVALRGTPKVLDNVFSVSIGGSSSLNLGVLAPPGTKLMVTGWTDFIGPGPAPSARPDAPAGRILTVLNVDPTNSRRVIVAEDTSDLPNAATSNFSFDVWLFPPAARVVGSSLIFETKPPVLEWIFF